MAKLKMWTNNRAMSWCGLNAQKQYFTVEKYLQLVFVVLLLTNFRSMFPFYTPWKSQKMSYQNNGGIIYWLQMSYQNNGGIKYN